MLREGLERRRLQQLPGIDRHEVRAHPLDLAEQVAREDDRDPELRAGSPDEVEHLVAAGRIEPVRRLVEEQQPRVVDERLGQLDPLLHAGRIAADRPVALLVQADVAQHLGGPLAGSGPWQAGHLRHVPDEVGRRRLGREAVVLRHVADELADLRAVGADVEVHDLRRAGGRLEEPEQELEHRALAGAVGADEADDPGLELEGQGVERGDAVAVALGQSVEGDEGHCPRGYRAGSVRRLGVSAQRRSVSASGARSQASACSR